MDKILEININTFKYDEDIVLSDIHLSVGKGECFVLTGLSGCGKSTLLRLINRLIPDIYEGTLDGCIEICGRDIYEYERGELAAYVGNVFQNMNDQFLSFYIEDEIALVGENMGMDPDLLRVKVAKAIEEFNLEPLLNTPIRQLSFGQKQKVAVASTMVFDSQIIVLDEPSASMDYPSILELKDTIAKLKAMGKTVIVAEHRLWYLKDLIDNLCVMRNGKIDCIYKGCQLNSEIEKKNCLRSFDENELEFKNITSVGQTLVRVDNLIVQNAGYSLHYPVSFDLGKGECMALIARNGMGKTTLARQLVGLSPIKQGSTSYASSARGRLNSTSICQQNSGSMFFFETVEKELIPKSRLQDDAYKQKAKELLCSLDLWDKKTEHPQVLSGGEKQRLSIELAVLKDSKLIVFDEPTAGLDYKRMDLSAEVIRAASQRTPVVVITHDFELLTRVANTVLMLQHDGYKKIDVKGNEDEILNFLRQAACRL